MMREGIVFASYGTLVDEARRTDTTPVAEALADAFAGLPTWHEWRALFDLAHIAVMTRPGHDARLPVELATEIAPRRARAASDLRTTPCGKVLDLPVTPLEISASAVRALLAAGRDPRWLVPDALLADPAMLDTYRRRADRSPSGK